MCPIYIIAINIYWIFFLAQADEDALKKPFKGIDCDKKTIINITVNRNNAQRLQIKKHTKLPMEEI